MEYWSVFHKSDDLCKNPLSLSGYNNLVYNEDIYDDVDVDVIDSVKELSEES